MMNTKVSGEVVNYKYWQSLRSVETSRRETRPTKEAIEFEKHLQQLEKENRLYEMGLAMKKASLQTNKDAVCSIEALNMGGKVHTKSSLSQNRDSHWYLTKDHCVDDEEDVANDTLLPSMTRPQTSIQDMTQPQTSIQDSSKSDSVSIDGTNNVTNNRS